MVPLYAARISDLGPDDFVQVECGCGHIELLTAAMLATAGVGPDTKLLDLKARLKCRECRWKGRVVVSIKWPANGQARNGCLRYPYANHRRAPINRHRRLRDTFTPGREVTRAPAKWPGRRAMPLYRCRYLDSTGSMVQVRVGAEDDAEAINMARSMSTNSGARWFDLFEGERFVLIWKEPAPRS